MIMKSIELHLLEAARDVDTAVQTGLVEPDVLNGLLCASCEDEVGHLTDASFVPFAVLIDERDTPWFVCGECIVDVVNPTTSYSVPSIEQLFMADEEFDDLDYEND